MVISKLMAIIEYFDKPFRCFVALAVVCLILWGVGGAINHMVFDNVMISLPILAVALLIVGSRFRN